MALEIWKVMRYSEHFLEGDELKEGDTILLKINDVTEIDYTVPSGKELELHIGIEGKEKNAE